MVGKDVAAMGRVVFSNRERAIIIHQWTWASREPPSSHHTSVGFGTFSLFIMEAIGLSVTKLDAIFSIVCLSSEVDISGR